MALERKGGERVEFEREGCSKVVGGGGGGGGGGGVNGVIVVSSLRIESSEGGDSHGGGMMLARRCRLRRSASQSGMVLRYGGWRVGIGPCRDHGEGRRVDLLVGFIKHFCCFLVRSRFFDKGKLFCFWQGTYSREQDSVVILSATHP